MQQQQWQAMLERRGYTVSFKQDGIWLECLIMGVGVDMRRVSDLAHTSYKGMRKQLDILLAHGMQHVMHTCGTPLLRAAADYVCYDTFYERSCVHVEYYQVPLRENARPLFVCPGCGDVLDKKTVHRVKDTE